MIELIHNVMLAHCKVLLAYENTPTTEQAVADKLFLNRIANDISDYLHLTKWQGVARAHTLLEFMQDSQEKILAIKRRWIDLDSDIMYLIAQAIGQTVYALDKGVCTASTCLEILQAELQIVVEQTLPKAVCCVIINKEDPTKILLVSRKDDPAMFGLPGGKIDAADTPPDGEDVDGAYNACIREVKEETGLDVVLYRPPIFQRACPRHAPEGTDYFAYAFVADDYSGNLQSTESGVLKWGTWEDQESGTFAGYNKGVRKALDKWKALQSKVR